MVPSWVIVSVVVAVEFANRSRTELVESRMREWESENNLVAVMTSLALCLAPSLNGRGRRSWKRKRRKKKMEMKMKKSRRRKEGKVCAPSSGGQLPRRMGRLPRA